MATTATATPTAAATAAGAATTAAAMAAAAATDTAATTAAGGAADSSYNGGSSWGPRRDASRAPGMFFIFIFIYYTNVPGLDITPTLFSRVGMFLFFDDDTSREPSFRGFA